jgi:hypothetical protein
MHHGKELMGWLWRHQYYWKGVRVSKPQTLMAVWRQIANSAPEARRNRVGGMSVRIIVLLSTWLQTKPALRVSDSRRWSLVGDSGIVCVMGSSSFTEKLELKRLDIICCCDMNLKAGNSCETLSLQPRAGRIISGVQKKTVKGIPVTKVSRHQISSKTAPTAGRVVLTAIWDVHGAERSEFVLPRILTRTLRWEPWKYWRCVLEEFDLICS